MKNERLQLKRSGCFQIKPKNDFFFKFSVFRGPPTPQSTNIFQTNNRKCKAYLILNQKMSNTNNRLSGNGGIFCTLVVIKSLKKSFFSLNFSFSGAPPPFCTFFFRLTSRIANLTLKRNRKKV